MLKRRFGRGYTLTITLSSEASTAEQELQQFVQTLMPSARLLAKPMGGTSKFEVMKEDVVLSQIFDAFESERVQGAGAMAIVDWGITETSLEEVFLKITELAERGIKPSR